MDIRDGVCAYLQGGFGNQLFILAAAWQQAIRLNVPLYIDASRFTGRDRLEVGYETPRDFALGDLALPGTVIVEESPWLRNSPRRPRGLRRTVASRRLKVFRETTPGDIDALDKIVPGTTLFGYFQSPRYFTQIDERVAAMLFSRPSDSASRNHATSEHTTVHLRRGDYMDPAVARHHGLATADYVRRALALLRTMQPSWPALVYSDSPEVARRELADLDDVTFVDESAGPLSDLETLVEMSRGNAFVMSNSSFSWWAAWLMSQRSDGLVIAPRPWSANGDSGHQLLLPNWVTLDAR